MHGARYRAWCLPLCLAPGGSEHWRSQQHPIPQSVKGSLRLRDLGPALLSCLPPPMCPDPFVTFLGLM